MPHGGQERHIVSGSGPSSTQEQDGRIPQLDYETLYNMVSTCNRRLAILRRVRARRRQNGEAPARNMDFDIENLERIQRLLVAMEKAAGGNAGPNSGHGERVQSPVVARAMGACLRHAPARGRSVEPLLPGFRFRPAAPRGTRGRAPTPRLPGLGN